MRVTRIKIDTFVLKVARTRDQEASCDDCAHHSARLIEVLLHGEVEDRELLDILHHVLQCMPCSQEFNVLKECAQMDVEDSWPSFDEMWRRIEQGR